MYLDHGQIPIVLNALNEVDERKRNHPVLYRRWVGVKRENLQFDRVEAIDGNGRL